jgi:membrane protein implicated in regulation of membrane protease activity
MGFLKGSIKVISNAVTLGGASRLEDAKASYQNSYAEHETLCKETCILKEQIDANVTAIGAALTAILPVLTRCERILKTSTGDKDNVRFSHTLETISSVEKFHSDYNAAIGIGAGTIAGGSLAVGSWALVGALGSASTGAAISGLSGVAATNATLAWFGGGALAAGGAGVSGGMAMLGGIVAVPLVAIASFGTHKKAREIEEEKIKLDKVIIQQKEHLATLPSVLEITREKKVEITERCNDFRCTTGQLIKIMRPFGIFSLLKQKILTLLRRDALTPEQAVAFQELDRKVAEFIGTFRPEAQST